ncbi:ABC transporter permease [Candidatus Bipolaricaulota bacterium]
MFAQGNKRLLRNVWRRPGGVIGLSVIAVLVFVSVFAPYLSPYGANQQSREPLQPPYGFPGGSSRHLLGTDSLGRDLLTRVLYGTRVSMLVGVCAVFVQGILGTSLGLLSGFYGGWVDNLITRLLDVQASIPFLVLAMGVLMVVGQGFSKVILVLGITGWITYARVIRGEILVIREKEYIEAARSVGASNMWIIMRHVLPNVFTHMIIVGTIQMPRMILAEASLSFLGLGVQPPTIAWGNMVAAGRDYLFGQWWIATMPGIAVFITVLGVNLLGDILRDVYDPMTR